MSQNGCKLSRMSQASCGLLLDLLVIARKLSDDTLLAPLPIRFVPRILDQSRGGFLSGVLFKHIRWLPAVQNQSTQRAVYEDRYQCQQRQGVLPLSGRRMVLLLQLLLEIPISLVL